MNLLLRKRPSSVAQRQVDPFYALQTDMNHLFSHFLREPFAESSVMNSHWHTQVDLKETPKEFILTADLPGFDKKDIHLSFENNLLTLKGERKSEETKDDEKHHYTERFYGTFERSFALSEEQVDKDKMTAKFDNGVLTVNIAKKPEKTKEARKIEIR